MEISLAVTKRFYTVRLKHFIVFPLNKEDLDSILLFVFCVSSLKYGKVVCGDELDRNYSKILTLLCFGS